MAKGEYYTFNLWELRAGYQGRELEELTRLGIIPQYGLVEGVREIKLFRIDEGNDAGKYLAVTVYESREAYNRWFTSTNTREFQTWQFNLRPTLARWVEVGGQVSSYRATLQLDHSYRAEEDLPPLPPITGPNIVF